MYFVFIQCDNKLHVAYCKKENNYCGARKNLPYAHRVTNMHKKINILSVSMILRNRDL